MATWQLCTLSCQPPGPASLTGLPSRTCQPPWPPVSLLDPPAGPRTAPVRPNLAPEPPKLTQLGPGTVQVDPIWPYPAQTQANLEPTWDKPGPT